MQGQPKPETVPWIKMTLHHACKISQHHAWIKMTFVLFLVPRTSPHDSSALLSTTIERVCIPSSQQSVENGEHPSILVMVDDPAVLLDLHDGQLLQ